MRASATSRSLKLARNSSRLWPPKEVLLTIAITTPMRLRLRCCNSPTMIRIRDLAFPQRFLARRRSPMSTKVTTTPSILSSTVRYGRRRMSTSRLLAVHFALDRSEIAQDLARVVGEVVVVETVGEVGDRPAFIAGRDVEQVGDARREALDAQLRVEEQDADIGRRHQVLHVAVGARHAFELHLEFAVDGLQLLVDRLQLLLAGLQLLGGRAVLLVDRLQLLVGGAQLLVRPLIFLSRGAQLRLAELQFLLKLLDLLAGACSSISRGRADLAERLAFEEEDDRRPGGAGSAATARLQIDPSGGAVEADRDRAVRLGSLRAKAR